MGYANTDVSNTPGDGGNNDAGTFNPDGDGALDIRVDNNLRTFIQRRSVVLNPLTNTAWDAAGVRAVALDNAERDTLIANANLNTAEAKHAGATLLAHLRLIKANAAGDPDQQLNAAAANWLTMNQAAINAAITAPIAADQLAALKEYKNAFDEVNDGGPNAGDLGVIAKHLA